MRQFYVLCVVFLLVFVVTTNASSPFYYGSNGTIPLKIDSSKVTIKFNESISQQSQSLFFMQVDRVDKVLVDSMMINGFIACSLTTSSGYDNFLDSLQNSNFVY